MVALEWATREMTKRSQANCDRYLDRLAQLVAQSSDDERRGLLALAKRLFSEQEQCADLEKLDQHLAARLSVRDSSTESVS